MYPKTVYRVLRRLWVRMWGRPKRSFVKEGADLEAGTGGGAQAPPPRLHDDGNNGNDQVHLMLLGPTRPLPFFTERPPPRLEERNMFVSTFNCGECSLESLAGRLGEWIPRGNVAVYVIGVQECMVMEGLKEAILDHVGRDAFMWYVASHLARPFSYLYG